MKKRRSLRNFIMTIVFAVIAVILAMQFFYFAYLSDMLASQNHSEVENLLVRINNDIEEQINEAGYMQEYILRNSDVVSFLNEADESRRKSLMRDIKSDVYNANYAKKDNLNIIIIEENGTVNNILNEASGNELEKISENIRLSKTNDYSEYITFFKTDDDPFEQLYVCVSLPIKQYNTKVVGLDHKGTLVVFQRLNMRKVALKNGYEGGIRFNLTSMDGENSLDFNIDLPEDGKYLIAEKPLQGTMWQIKAEAVHSNANSELNRQRILIAVEILVIMALMLVMQRLLYENIAKPAETILKYLSLYRLGKSKQKIPCLSTMEFNELSMHINEMLDNMWEMTRSIVSNQRMLYEKEISENKAIIYALQSQINPHFLYNTLDCMGSMAMLAEQDDIYSMCMGISDILRYSIQKDAVVTVEDEVAITEKYISIQQTRFNGGFDVEIDIDDGIWAVEIPRMCIQPIVENAFKHGMIDSGWIIEIRGYQEEDIVKISVMDNGSGMEEEKYKELVEKLACNSGDYLNSDEKGLINIDKRLKLTYGPDYGILVKQEYGKSMEVIMKLPFDKNKNTKRKDND